MQFLSLWLFVVTHSQFHIKWIKYMLYPTSPADFFPDLPKFLASSSSWKMRPRFNLIRLNCVFRETRTFPDKHLIEKWRYWYQSTLNENFCGANGAHFETELEDKSALKDLNLRTTSNYLQVPIRSKKF